VVLPSAAIRSAPLVNEPVVQIAKGAERIAADGSTTDPAIEELMSARLSGVTSALGA